MQNIHLIQFMKIVHSAMNLLRKYILMQDQDGENINTMLSSFYVVNICNFH